MKIIASLLLIFIGVNYANSQVTVYLKSGNFVNNNPEKNPTNDAANFADYIYDGNYFLWLQFSELPTEENKKTLIETGVKLYDYLPRNTYIASFPVNYNFNILSQYNVYAVTKPLAAAKIDVALYTPSQIVWAVAANGNLKVNVSFSTYTTIDKFLASLNTDGISFSKIENLLDDVVAIEASMNDIQRIAMHPLVQYIEPIGHPGMEEDIQAVTTHRTTSVQTSDNWINGKKLDGTGVNIAIGDGTMIGTHIDFQGRLLHNSSSTAVPTVYHSDHCSGIICGAGNLNPQVRGQAPGSTLSVYDNYEPYNLFPSIYNSDSIRIVSHSLGQVCNAGYDANAKTSDQLIRKYPSLMYVHSAGNSGPSTSQSSCGGLAGWKEITGGFKAGKNVITVANLSKTDVIDGSSSRGPLKDGRIKPDIAAVGSSVNSTQPDNTFTVLSGTSMACPAVAGNIAVMYHAYKKSHNGNEPEGSLIKAIALNTADDLGNTGPDFTYGFGRINTRRAVSCIENNRYIVDSVTTGVTKSFTINIPANVNTAKVMVYWNDKDGNAGAAKSLVNNLDAKIISAANDTTLPWVIDLSAGQDATTCAASAVNGIDSVNNEEQIQLNGPNAGAYTLKVIGKAVPYGPQKFYIVYEYLYTDEIVVTHPIGGESFVPNESQRLRWDATPTIDNFKIEYSLNGGTTWTTISSSVAPDRRYYDWLVPAAATTKSAKIRISHGGTASDESDTSFIILKVPTGLTFTDICKGTVKLSWNAVTGATSYDVCRLGEKYMDVVATTTTTNVTLNDVGDTLNLFAIRAKLAATQANGRRSNAISHTDTSTLVCTVPVKLISFNAILKSNFVQLDWIVANEEGLSNYTIEKSLTPNFDVIEIVGQLKPHNTLTTQQYQLFDKNIKSSGIWYYRLKIDEVGVSRYSNIQAIRIDKFVSNLFSISPNPAVNVINLTAQNDVANAVIKLYNELGVEVINKKISNITVGQKIVLQTNNAANGNYFLNVIDAANGTIIYKQQITIAR